MMAARPRCGEAKKVAKGTGIMALTANARLPRKQKKRPPIFNCREKIEDFRREGVVSGHLRPRIGLTGGSRNDEFGRSAGRIKPTHFPSAYPRLALRRNGRRLHGSLHQALRTSTLRVVAMTQILGVALRGTGSCLPSRVVPNDEFTDTLNLDTTDEWIRTRTGIRERRFADLGETSASLGAIAARRALESAAVAAADIDLIVCATATPDLMSPATACLIQAALGCRHIPAFDISAACSGFLYGLSVAAQFIRTGAAQHALVVGTEVLSRALDFSDRNSCILFGDGAGAVILAASPIVNGGIRNIRL